SSSPSNESGAETLQTTTGRSSNFLNAVDSFIQPRQVDLASNRMPADYGPHLLPLSRYHCSHPDLSANAVAVIVHLTGETPDEEQNGNVTPRQIKLDKENDSF